jgi:curved DNA-binding protein CbpA
MDDRPWYKVLEVPPTASEEEIRQAYRDLVHVWHPDRLAKQPRLRRKAEQKLQDLNRAYETALSFHAERKRAAGGGQKGEERKGQPVSEGRIEAAVEAGTRAVLTFSFSLFRALRKMKE